MIITPVDSNHNLFHVQDIIPSELVDRIMTTDWMSLSWSKNQLQQGWNRRLIRTSSISWYAEWRTAINSVWPAIIDQLGPHGWPYPTYPETNFWVDEPGFNCGLHVDGGLIGAMQLYWIGDADTGTCFYHTKQLNDVRYQFPFLPNQGYLLVTKPTVENYTPLQWHAATAEIRPNTYRVTSYTRATCPPQPEWTL